MPKGKPTSGKRKPGAGRPKTNPTKTIAFRVPIDQEFRIKMMVKNYLKDLKATEK